MELIRRYGLQVVLLAIYGAVAILFALVIRAIALRRVWPTACGRCGKLYADHLAACPRCGEAASAGHLPDGREVPKDD